MDKKKIISLFSLIILMVNSIFARENVGTPPANNSPQGEYKAADCDPATSEIDMSINNARVRILGGGDMWWDLNKTPQYEIPKGGGVSSLFSGALWIGGKDQNGNLKVAAMTYRQNGNDFWPGPVGSSKFADKSTCLQYDNHYKVSREEVEEYVTAYKAGKNPSIPQSMLNWPAHGNTAIGQDYYLAPFFDSDGDTKYDPSKGDYPNFDLDGTQGNSSSVLYGDESIWWIFNDVGNIHGESKGLPIGLQIKAQAFGFSTDDEVNNMTFYNYIIENKSSFDMEETYFGQWVDPDLGGPRDDYIGCDVERGFGYCYNADEDDAPDQGSPGYGATPPAVGLDFFKGPIADLLDGIDNDRDGTTDEAGEEIIMSNFMYYYNDQTQMGNPTNATQYYGYLRNYWKDGTHLEYDGNGWPGSGLTNGSNTNFAFPDNTDATKYGSYGAWSQKTENDVPGDLRFILSAGPFTLKSGAVNTVTVGALWARAQSGATAWSSVQTLQISDDIAQALFDNNFKILNGPKAPDLEIKELENKLILTLQNSVETESYTEEDPLIDPTGIKGYDKKYRFQGYQIFQLKDETVSAGELTDITKARLVAQCDIHDSVSQLINYKQDQAMNTLVPTEMVKGADKGIVHSFVITSDEFATGSSNTLVNHKPYYYMAVAYGYNNFKTFSYANPSSYDGQKKPYKMSRLNVKVYEGMPHLPSPQDGGTIMNSSYGLQPKLTRIKGKGHGAEFINLSPQTISDILENNTATSVTYNNDGAPINIKVIDPLNIPEGNFTFKFLDTVTTNDVSDAYWILIHQEKNDTVYADHTIKIANEQIIKKWGLSVTAKYAYGPADSKSLTNGYIDASMTFGKDGSGLKWLTGVKDFDGTGAFSDWIRSGVGDDDITPGTDKTVKLDPNQDYEKILEGIISPYRITSYKQYGPQWEFSTSLSANKFSYISSVDIVLTSDKSKWSRCVVLETFDDPSKTIGNAGKLDLRQSPSVDKEGKPDNSGTMGMGWFPGYAINVETGVRLNIAFGENSYQVENNGADMIWNPTNNLTNLEADTVKATDIIYGGMHSIYVFQGEGASPNAPVYDGCAYYYSQLSQYNANLKINVTKDITWVYPYPLANPVFGYLPIDVAIKLRVAKPYAKDISQKLPEFTFNTADIKTVNNDANTAKISLDKINVVPNPYYGYSSYEQEQLDRIVKIVNLPDKCKIRIFTLNGTLVKTFNKDDRSTTNIEWNLDNDAGVPIASGMYLIHVEVEGVGEKILKWFGVMRQTDLSTF